MMSQLLIRSNTDPIKLKFPEWLLIVFWKHTFVIEGHFTLDWWHVDHWLPSDEGVPLFVINTCNNPLGFILNPSLSSSLSSSCILCHYFEWFHVWNIEVQLINGIAPLFVSGFIQVWIQTFTVVGKFKYNL